MKFFGLEIRRAKEFSAVPVRPYTGLFGAIRESFAGAWQRNIEVEGCQNLLAFSAVYSCVSRIADDISKMRIMLVEEDENGIYAEVEAPSPFLALLAKPNSYQTRIQFLSAWITAKLLWGNAYIYLQRNDLRGLVTSMHVLESRHVTPLVSPSGAVYYQLRRDDLSGVVDAVPPIPADRIIHDRMITAWHPLVGISPIYACGSSATQGIRIQNNSARFFENMSRPSGMLTAPSTIDEVTSARLKKEFESAMGGSNIGRLFVAGDALKYEPMTMPAADAQLVEQLKWTVEDVARCFHVPLYKIGAGAAPTFNNIGALNQDYYGETLQQLIECVELLLTEGLGIDANNDARSVKLDIDCLLRMDQLGTISYLKDAVGAGILKPNEGRKRLNYSPVKGGDTPYLQVQNYGLEALAARDANGPPVTPGVSAPALPAPAPADPQSPAEPRPAGKAFDAMMARLESLEKAIADKPPEELDGQALLDAIADGLKAEFEIA